MVKTERRQEIMTNELGLPSADFRYGTNTTTRISGRVAGHMEPSRTLPMVCIRQIPQHVASII